MLSRLKYHISTDIVRLYLYLDMLSKNRGHINQTDSRPTVGGSDRATVGRFSARFKPFFQSAD